MTVKEEIYNFLKTQKLLIIASQAEELWITNVYYGVDEELTLYFISSENTKHSKQIMKNPEVAFSIASFNPENHCDRKAIQGKGICEICTEAEEIITGVQLHNINFPEFKERITVDWIKTNEKKSRVWKITFSSIKFWNDELYGEEGTRTLNSS